MVEREPSPNWATYFLGQLRAASASVASSLALKQSTAQRGVAGGYAALDGGGKVVQDPTNATDTPASGKIPMTVGLTYLKPGWFPIAGGVATLAGGTIDVDVSALPQRIDATAGDTILLVSGKRLGGSGRSGPLFIEARDANTLTITSFDAGEDSDVWWWMMGTPT